MNSTPIELTFDGAVWEVVAQDVGALPDLRHTPAEVFEILFPDVPELAAGVEMLGPVVSVEQGLASLQILDKRSNIVSKLLTIRSLDSRLNTGLLPRALRSKTPSLLATYRPSYETNTRVLYNRVKNPVIK
ncbi:MAG: hypothetical protein AAFR35_05500 [Pseudomonadota bacterium]